MNPPLNATDRRCIETKGAWIICLILGLTASAMGGPLSVTVSPASTVVQREGITGAGQVVAATASALTVHYPNHPDDFGGSGGTGTSVSTDGGLTWTQGADDWPLPKMVDLWQDRLRNGDMIAFGIRWVPDPKKRGQITAKDVPADAYEIATSKDQGRTWRSETAVIECPAEFGVIARPLPHVIEDEEGTLFMPAYAWGKHGNHALLLTSADRGKRWTVRSSITTAAAMVKAGTPVTTPWLETTVARTSDGAMLAIIRTGSSAQAALVSARSTDAGRTWTPVTKLSAGPQRRNIAGKLPTLHLLPNGVLALLTAHSKNHCRLYFSADGTGREWSDAHILTSQSGGNAGMTVLDDHTLLVIAPANRRIDSWRVTVKPTAPLSSGTAGPTDIALTKGRLTWTAPADAGDITRYQITPILLKPAAANTDTEIYPCAPIQTRDATPHIELGRLLSIGGTYQFAIAALHHDGTVSASEKSTPIIATP